MDFNYRAANPHPSPNKIAPNTSLKSTVLLLGNSNFSAKRGLWFFFCNHVKVIIFNPTEVNRRIIKDGSHLFCIAKNI